MAETTTATPAITTANPATPFSWQSDVLYPALALLVAIIVFSVTMALTLGWSAKTTFGISGGITTIVFTRHVLRRLGYRSRFITLMVYGALLVTLWPLVKPHLGFHTNQALDERGKSADLEVAEEISAPTLGLQSALHEHKRARLDQLTIEYDRALVAIRNDQSLTLEEKKAREQEATAKYNSEAAAVSSLTVSDPKIERIKQMFGDTAKAVKDKVGQWTDRLRNMTSSSQPASNPCQVPIESSEISVRTAKSLVDESGGRASFTLNPNEERCFNYPTYWSASGPHKQRPRDYKAPVVGVTKGGDYLTSYRSTCYIGWKETVRIEVWPKNG